MSDPNRERLLTAAEMLRPVLAELVFLGGGVTSLLVTDEGAGAPRTTLDVDTIAEISRMPHTLHLAIASGSSASPRTPAKDRRCVDGFKALRFSTSCPSMRRFSASPI